MLKISKFCAQKQKICAQKNASFVLKIEILHSENSNFALIKNSNGALNNSPEFCAQKMEILHSRDGNSALRKRKFYAQTMEKFSNAMKSLLFYDLKHQIEKFRAAAVKSKFSTKFYDHRILQGLYISQQMEHSGTAYFCFMEAYLDILLFTAKHDKMTEND